jgi:hypothetical protein
MYGLVPTDFSSVKPKRCWRGRDKPWREVCSKLRWSNCLSLKHCLVLHCTAVCAQLKSKSCRRRNVGLVNWGRGKMTMLGTWVVSLRVQSVTCFCQTLLSCPMFHLSQSRVRILMVHTVLTLTNLSKMILKNKLHKKELFEKLMVTQSAKNPLLLWNLNIQYHVHRIPKLKCILTHKH